MGLLRISANIQATNLRKGWPGVTPRSVGKTDDFGEILARKPASSVSSPRYPAYARFSAAMSSFFFCSMAVITRPDFAGSGSVIMTFSGPPRDKNY